LRKQHRIWRVETALLTLAALAQSGGAYAYVGAPALLQPVGASPDWNTITVIGLLGAIISVGGGLLIAGTLRIGNRVDLEQKEQDAAHARELAAKDAIIQIERERGNKWEALAMEQFKNLERINEQLNLALKLAAAKEKGEPH
jgi:predicted transglutaminase-like cysteine proteinase